MAGGRGGASPGTSPLTFNHDQPLEDAQAQAFINDHNTENGHFSEIDEYYFASRVCCLLSSHCLPDDIHVVPADGTTMILPPDAHSLSTASCVTSGAVADTGNDQGVTNSLEHIMSFTGENVNLIRVHGNAIKCAANRSCLLPVTVSRLMHHGFKFNHAIPADANQHGFGKYEDYGGTITTPDGITIVMVHHEH